MSPRRAGLGLALLCLLLHSCASGPPRPAAVAAPSAPGSPAGSVAAPSAQPPEAAPAKPVPAGSAGAATAGPTRPALSATVSPAGAGPAAPAAPTMASPARGLQPGPGESPPAISAPATPEQAAAAAAAPVRAAPLPAPAAQPSASAPPQKTTPSAPATPSAAERPAGSATTPRAAATATAPAILAPPAIPAAKAGSSRPATTTPAPAIAAAAPATPATPAASASTAPPDAVSGAAAARLEARVSLPPLPEPSAYLRRALAEFESAPLPGGGRILVKRSPGSDRGAAVFAFSALLEREGPERRGLAAFALGLAAEGQAGQAPGEFARLLEASGGSLALAELGAGRLGLLLEAPRSALPELLSRLDAAIADPAFLREGYPQPRAEAVLRELRLAERLRSRDPVEAARPRLGLPASSLGTKEGLGSLNLAAARAFWGSGVPRGELLVLADLEAAGLSALLSSRAASISGLAGGAGVAAARPAGAGQAEPSRAALPAPPPPSAEGPAKALAALRIAKRLDPAVLLAFAAPRSRDTEAAALLVALELLEDEARRESGGRWGGAGGGPRAYFLDGAGLGLLRAEGGERLAARKALELALRSLRASLAEAPHGEGLPPLAARLEAAKARALVRAYGGLSRSQIALALASEIAAGGDGSAFYRLEGLISAVGLEELRRALDTWLAPEKLLWLDGGS